MIALPLHSSVTAQDLTDKFKSVFSVLCPTWRQKMLAVTTDGEAKMTGHHHRFVTNLDSEVTEDLIWVWCGAHQLDLVSHCFYKKIYYFHLFLP